MSYSGTRTTGYCLVTLKPWCSQRICHVVCASPNVMRPIFLCESKRKEGCCDDTSRCPGKYHPDVFNTLMNNLARNLSIGSLCAHDGKVMHSLASRLLPLKVVVSLILWNEMPCAFWTGTCYASHWHAVSILCLASCRAMCYLGHMPSPCHMWLVRPDECACYVPRFLRVEPSVCT